MINIDLGKFYREELPRILSNVESGTFDGYYFPYDLLKAFESCYEAMNGYKTEISWQKERNINNVLASEKALKDERERCARIAENIGYSEGLEHIDNQFLGYLRDLKDYIAEEIREGK